MRTDEPLHVALLAGESSERREASDRATAPQGSPVPTPLVLLHGFTGSTATWLRLAPHLGNDRPIYAVDLPGHGESPAPENPAAYSMAAVVAAVWRAVADAGIQRAHWIGYSMGGRVALCLALADPSLFASLTLIGASPGLPDPEARTLRIAADERLAAMIETQGLVAFVDYWMALPLFATQARLGEAFLERARTARMRNRPHALALTLRGMGTGTMPPILDRFDLLQLPVLYVAGSEDPKFRDIGEAVVERLPHGELAVVAGSGHAVQLEAPEALAGVVRSFLERVEAA